MNDLAVRLAEQGDQPEPLFDVPVGPQQIGLFEGYGGLSMAVAEVLAAELVAYSEVDPAASKVLAHHHPDVPNLGDITLIDWTAVRLDTERQLILTGGFPCQDVSSAGRRAGMRPGTRSGLWTHMAYAISQLRPELVVIENVRGLLSADAACDLEPCPWCLGDDEGRPLRALGAVLGDLAELGYDARWVGLRAADVGAPHGRFRVFVTAWPVQDADVAARGERRLAAPGQTQGGWARPDTCGRGGAPAADPAGPGGRRDEQVDATADGAAANGSGQAEPGRRDRATADARGAGRQGAVGQVAIPIAIGQREAADGSRTAAAERGPAAWGDYEPAIRRWEHILGRPAPAPTLTGKRGGQQLSAGFVEWLMGLPEGYVTDVPGLTRNDQLARLGNGVVPQQAAAALRYLLASNSMERAA